VVDGMTIPEMLARVTPRGLDTMRWIFFVTGIALIGAACVVRNGDARGHALAFAAGLVACVILWQPGAPGVEHVLAILLVCGLVVWRGDFAIPTGQRAHARGAMAPGGFAALFTGVGFGALPEHFVAPLRPPRAVPA